MAYDVNVLVVDRLHAGSEQAVRLWMADGYDAMMNHHAKNPLARYLMVAAVEGANGFENIVNASPKLDILLTLLVTRLERVRQAFQQVGRSQFVFNVDAVLERADKERLGKMVDSYVAATRRVAAKADADRRAGSELQPGAV